MRGVVGYLMGRSGRGLSDASVLEMNRMVCSRGGVRLASSSLSLVFCLGRMPCLVLEPWIGFGGPSERLGASLRISLMLCNYIKFQKI